MTEAVKTFVWQGQMQLNKILCAGVEGGHWEARSGAVLCVPGRAAGASIAARRSTIAWRRARSCLGGNVSGHPGEFEDREPGR